MSTARAFALPSLHIVKPNTRRKRPQTIAMFDMGVLEGGGRQVPSGDETKPRLVDLPTPTRAPATRALFDLETSARLRRKGTQAALPLVWDEPVNKKKHPLPLVALTLFELAKSEAALEAWDMPLTETTPWRQQPLEYPTGAPFERFRERVTPVPSCPLARLTTLIKGLYMDDALVCGDWRLELVRLDEGFPFYALYYQGRLLGGADIKMNDAEDYQVHRWKGLPALQHKLALLLRMAGWDATETERHEGAAITDLDGSKKDVTPIFD